MSHHGKNSSNNSKKNSRKEYEEKPREKKKKSFFESAFNTRGSLKTSNTFVKMKNVEGVQFGDCFYGCTFPEQSCNKNPSDCASETTFEEESDNESTTAEETEKTNNVIKKQDEKTDLSILKIVEDDVRYRRKNLYQEYTSWDKNTSENIKCLQKICDQMNNPFNSKCVVFSRFSTIGGSIIGMAGVVVTVPTDRLHLALIFGGTSLATIVGISLFITNNYLSNQLCKNAKENFELNIEKTKKVEELKNDYFQLLRQSKNKLIQLKENDPEVQENLKEIFNDLDLNEMIQSTVFPSVSVMENMRPNEKILNQKMIMFEYTKKLITLIRNSSINNIKVLMHKHLPKNLHKLIDIFLLLMQAPGESKIDCIIMIIKEIGRIGSKEIIKNLSFNEILIGKPIKISLFILNAAFFCWGMRDLIKTSIIKNRETNQSREIIKTANNLQKYQQDVKDILKENFKEISY